MFVDVFLTKWSDTVSLNFRGNLIQGCGNEVDERMKFLLVWKSKDSFGFKIRKKWRQCADAESALIVSQIRSSS